MIYQVSMKSWLGANSVLSYKWQWFRVISVMMHPSYRFNAATHLLEPQDFEEFIEVQNDSLI